jgi:hypothetical protein
MPLQETSGNLTTDAFGGGVAAVTNYIEDVFSTYLYDATGATQSITNGIDLSTKGGLVWIKDRTIAYNNCLFDTERGVNKQLYSNATNAQVTAASSLTNFNTNGFTLGADGSFGYVNNAGSLASWTFRKQAKFFDIVTYTGTGSATTIAHNLGSVPGCIIVKRTDATGTWPVYHAGLNNGSGKGQWYQILNTSAITGLSSTYWNNTAPTSTVFSIGTNANVNASGGTYVAYIFADNAGGFGVNSTDNVISCGSFTTDGSGLATINLGYEPQFVIVKGSNISSPWFIFDNMRGWSYASANNLNANQSNAEIDQGANLMFPTATGFQVGGSGGAFLASSSDFIYIAIRRGPMKVPTDATKVFTPIARTGTATDTTITTPNFVTDLVITQSRQGNANPAFFDRLRGATIGLYPNGSSAEFTSADGLTGFDSMTGYKVGADQSQGTINFSPWTYSNWTLRRAPSFFDEVCYTGTGSATTITHNLGAVPELMIVKSRSDTYSWYVYNQTIGATNGLVLNTTAASTSLSIWNSTAPTSSVFSIASSSGVNLSGGTYVAYLFATCAGVSKVGTYTGNGTTQTINCGFTGGSRLVLIKRTDSTGSWYVYDTARGMTTVTDPYLQLNSNATEAATLGSVTTATTGFALNASILSAVNTNAATYIFLAIA